MSEAIRAIPQATTEPLQVRVVEAPKVRFWHDSSRILALSAFLFSVMTGGYATYQTWLTYRDAQISKISNLIDRYYKISEERSKLSPASATFGIMVTEEQSIASQLMRTANSIKELIDDSDWNAIAQIEGSEGLYKYSEDAYTVVIGRQNADYEYWFARRGAGFAQIGIGNDSDGVDILRKTIQDLEKAKTMKNFLSDFATELEISYNYADIIFRKNVQNDCNSLKYYYDESQQSINKAKAIAPSDPRIKAAQDFLDQWKSRRESCDINQFGKTPQK